MLVTTNAGELELLNKMLKAALTTDENYILKLYKSNTTPSATTVIGDLTEADFTGYAAYTLTRTGWSSAATVSGKAESSYGTTCSFTCGATGNTIYGYSVQGATSSVLQWAEKFSSPRVLANGEILNVIPKFTLNSES